MRDHLQRIRLGIVERVTDGEIFGEGDVVPTETPDDRVLVSLLDLERITLAQQFEILDGMRRGQFEMDVHLARC